MKRNISRWAMAAGLACLSGASLAQGGTLYYSRDGHDELYSLSTSTGAATFIGPTGVNSSTVGLCESGDPGYLYGSTPFGLNKIYTNGSAPTLINGSFFSEGMAFDPGSSTIYSIINESFASYDTSGNLITDLTDPSDDVEGLAWGHGGVFGIVGFGSTDSNLYFYDPGADNWSLVGDTGVDWNECGLAYDPGSDTLYAKGLQDSMLYAINPNTAATTLIGDTGMGEGGGLAFVSPVPEPTTMAVLAIGALAAMRRRKK